VFRVHETTVFTNATRPYKESKLTTKVLLWGAALAPGLVKIRKMAAPCGHHAGTIAGTTKKLSFGAEKTFIWRSPGSPKGHFCGQFAFLLGSRGQFAFLLGSRDILS